MFKKKYKIISLVLICMMACLFCTACVQDGEPPKMKVTSGKKEIPCLISKEIWNGEEVKAVNPFQVYVKKNKKIVSLNAGDQVCMEFEELNGEGPDSIELRIYALNEDGTFADEEADPQIVEVELKDKKVEFEVPEYLTDAKAYGYDLRCKWTVDICRYNFVMK